jgi:hypothetical protein
MNCRRSLFVFVALLAIAFSSSLRAAEMVDNPQYTSWAAHKPGTNVTITQDMKMGAMNMTNTMVETLKEVTPEKLTVEFAVTMNLGGQKQETKQTRDVPAKVEKGHEYLPPEVKGTAKETGKEKIEIAGKTYECKIIDFSGESAQAKSTGKIWQTSEIPGAMAKTEMNMTNPQEATVKMTVTAIDSK